MLLLITKGTNLKAIHNIIDNPKLDVELLLITKGTNLKAIHNPIADRSRTRSLLLITKGTNLKAIHNQTLTQTLRKSVVTNNQRYKFESNSQLCPLRPPQAKGCY